MLSLMLILAAQAEPGIPSPSPLKDVRLEAACERDESFCDAVAVGTPGRWHCSGVVVGPRAVLTARHCLPATRVGVGGDLAAVTRTAVVERVQYAPAPVDLVLLTVDADLSIEARPRWTDPRPPDLALLAVGFGSPDARTLGRHREGVWLDMGPRWGCDLRISSVAGCLAGLELVATSERGKDTCNGDSGGPIYARTEDGWTLVGVTSRPVRSSLLACGEGGIFVRVDALQSWLSPRLEEG